MIELITVAFITIIFGYILHLTNQRIDKLKELSGLLIDVCEHNRNYITSVAERHNALLEICKDMHLKLDEVEQKVSNGTDIVRHHSI